MLVLLDIDGVMIPAKSWERPEILNDDFMRFSTQATLALQKIINHTSANILLTTSHKDKFSVKEWKDIFKRRNIILNKIEKLPKNSNHLNRMDEIINWFSSGNIKENFVIIDDDKILNNLPEYLKQRLILTSSTIGLTDYLADEAIENLKGQQYEFVKM
jgi:hypothetical protein